MKRISDFKSLEDYQDWYNSPATPDQIAYCASLGKCMSDPVGCRGYWKRGDVSQWIDELKAGTYYLVERA